VLQIVARFAGRALNGPDFCAYGHLCLQNVFEEDYDLVPWVWRHKFKAIDACSDFGAIGPLQE
jgi:hypothetical protein